MALPVTLTTSAIALYGDKVPQDISVEMIDYYTLGVLLMPLLFKSGRFWVHEAAHWH